MFTHNPTSRYRRVRRSGPKRGNAARAIRLAAGIVVFGVWIATIVSAMTVVETYGSRSVPVGDDIHATLPTVLPPFSEAVRGFWDAHNEHRVPLPRLILWIVLNATDFNLRAMMHFNVLICGLHALVMILTARKIRGYISWPDAFFPLVILCLSQYSNFIIAWQVQFMLSTFLAGILLCLFSRKATQPSPRGAVLAGACLLMLPLSGANGVAMVPALAVWFGISGVMIWRSPPARWRWHGGLLIGSAVTALAVIGAYFIRLKKPDDLFFKGAPIPNPGLRDYLRTGIEFLGSALGEPLYQALEQSLEIKMVALLLYGGAAVLLLALISGVALAFIVYRRPSESYRAFGFAVFLAANGCVLAAVTWGRAPVGEGAGAADRYYTLMVPVLCWVYLIWVLNGRAIGWVMQAVLLIAAGVVYKENVRCALDRAGMIRDGSKAVEQAVAAGKPIPQIAQIWSAKYAQGDPDYFISFFVQRFQMLQRESIGPYRRLPDAPPLREVPYALDVPPAGVENATWAQGVFQVVGPDAWLVLSLPEPRFVYAIRVTGRYENLSKSMARFEISWRLIDHTKFDTSPSGVYLPRVLAEDQPVTVIVNETIDQFRIQPSEEPCTFHITRIELLVPAVQ